MADRSVRVRLEANVDGFRSAMSTAAKSVQDFDKRATGYIQNHKASINEVSNAALGIGAGLLAASGMAAKAAMDWESAWAGVTKTVDGTDQQMASLEAGLRDMATNLPATHAEIAAVAEAAGQLGIATPNIESFTRTMIDLGEATNMTAEQGATELARFMNIMGTSQGDVSKLGSAIVGLGNNFATTESEILEMSLRLAGTSNQAGLTEGEVMGLAAAMSSVGIEAQAGGTAMSMGMRKITDAVDEGGESLEGFAEVAGMSADEFSRLWEEDPAAGLEAFVQGLARVSAEGGNVASVLGDLGIKGIRESDTFLRLAGAADILGDSMAQGNEEFEANIALAEEASERYQTAESRLSMMRNAMVDLGIDVGASVAPALADVADNVSFLIGKFQELPDSVKGALGVGTGIVGMSLLAVGGLGRALTAASDLRLAMDNLGIATGKTSRKMKLLGVGSAVGIAITGLALALGHFIGEAATAEQHAEQLADTFDDLTGAATADTDRILLDQLSETLETTDWRALEDLGVSVSDVIEAVKAGGPELDGLRDRLFELGTDAGPEAQEAIGALERAIGPANKAFVEGAEAAEFERQALEEVGAQSEGTAASQQILEDAVVDLDGSIKETTESMKEFVDMLFEAGLRTMDVRTAQGQYHESIRGVGETVDELIEKHGGLGDILLDTGEDFDVTTTAGYEANEAFQDVAKSGMDMASSMAEANASQEEIQGSLQGTYDDLVEAAGQFGITGDAAHDLAREVLGIPDGVDIETWMDDEAERQARDTQDAIDGIDRWVDVTVTTKYVETGRKRVTTGVGGNQFSGLVSSSPNADGNVWPSPGRVKQFANGSENHVAQIAPAGAWRLWAEPETGGEAYIPLAESKRARSMNILADVAARFGHALMPYANGGVAGMPGASYMPFDQSFTITHLLPSQDGGGTTYSPTFHNYNTDAVRATREQVAQFQQTISAMPVGVPG